MVSMNNETSLADRLKIWRKRRKITQAQAATILQASIDTVRSWEQGKAIPSTVSQQFIFSKGV